MFFQKVKFLMVGLILLLWMFSLLYTQDSSGAEQRNYQLAVKLFRDAVEKFKSNEEEQAFQLYLKAFSLYPRVIYFDGEGILLYAFDKLVKDRVKCLHQEKEDNLTQEVVVTESEDVKSLKKQLQILQSDLKAKLEAKDKVIQDLEKQIEELQKEISQKESEIKDLEEKYKKELHLKRVWRARALRLPPYTNYNPPKR